MGLSSIQSKRLTSPVELRRLPGVYREFSSHKSLAELQMDLIHPLVTLVSNSQHFHGLDTCYRSEGMFVCADFSNQYSVMKYSNSKFENLKIEQN